MNCIAIDTTDTDLCVALIKGDEVFSLREQIGKSGHSSKLMPIVDKMLCEYGVDVQDIDTVAAVVGPGSFTGIRIGISAITAIAFAQNAKRIAVTSFELIAYNRKKALVAVDAGHGNLYVADCENGVVTNARFVEADKAVDVKDAVYDTLGDKAETLAKVVMEKARKGEYVDVLEPFYMRKSQAEMEKDEV